MHTGTVCPVLFHTTLPRTRLFALFSSHHRMTGVQGLFSSRSSSHESAYKDCSLLIHHHMNQRTRTVLFSSIIA
eukprot:1161640-Pelagomonas_calceolata.AAC.6